jgi:hypothetical protein
MKSFEGIERMVKASRVLASGATDERILGNAADAPSTSGSAGPATMAVPAPTTQRRRPGMPIRIAAVVAVAAGLLVVLFPGGNGLISENLVFADVQKAMEQQRGVHITGIRRCTFPAEANLPEEVYLCKTEKWASHEGYIDVTYDQNGTRMLQVCYHFDTGTITVTYDFLKQYYRLQVPQAYRDRLRGIGPVGLIETLFQSGDAKRLGAEQVQGKDAIGFEVSNVAQRLDETVSPPWVRFFFLNLKESKVRLWIDPETRLPIHMEGDFWLQGCLFSDFTTMRMEETNDQWQWDSGLEELLLFPEKPEDYVHMAIPGAP